MAELKKKPLFNPEGDIDVRLRRMIGGNTTRVVIGTFPELPLRQEKEPIPGIPCHAAHDLESVTKTTTL